MRYLMLILILCAAPIATVSAAPPPGNIYETAPFTSAQLFTSVPCGTAFSCNASVNDTTALAAANTCATSRLGFPANMMTLFITDGGVYNNCALPETFAPKAAGLAAYAQWPICCIEDRGNDRCEFSCYYYRSNPAAAQ